MFAEQRVYTIMMRFLHRIDAEILQSPSFAGGRDSRPWRRAKGRHSSRNPICNQIANRVHYASQRRKFIAIFVSMYSRYFLNLLLLVGACGSATAAQPTTFEERPVNLSQFTGAADDAAQVVTADAGSWPTTLLLIYCVFIVAASLLGGWLPSWIRLTHTRMQTVISFVGGLMLGIGVFHLLPHAVEQLGSAKQMAHWMMVGIVMMFVLIRLFHFHNHEPVSPGSPALATCSHGHDHDHDHDHSHDHDVPEVVALGTQQTQTGKGHTAAECHSHGHAHGMSWMGIALGLSLHTLIEGLALGASVHADSQRMAAQSMLGFGTFLAIVLHKPLDSVSITALMLSSNWNSRTINLVNIGFALMCPIGAVLVLMGVSQFSGMQRELLGTALSFAAGVFICIALSDLLPEMEFHAHNKVQLTVALGLGIALSWALTLLESGHLH